MHCATNPRRRRANRSQAMAAGVFSAARELPRLREISSVLIRHGLGDLVRRAGIATLLERAGQVLRWGESSEIAHLEPQQRAKLAFEQLGPTFVKLGQILSTREDLLPPTWRHATRSVSRATLPTISISSSPASTGSGRAAR